MGSVAGLNHLANLQTQLQLRYDLTPTVTKLQRMNMLACFRLAHSTTGSLAVTRLLASR